MRRGEDERRELPMAISMHKVGSSAGEGYVHLRIQDQASRAIFADVEMSFEAFTRALFGEGCTPCIVRVSLAAPIGKERQVKRELVPIPIPYPVCSAAERELAEDAVAPFEVDGWRCTRPRDVLNGHNRRGTDASGVARAEVAFERWVDRDTDDHLILPGGNVR